MCVRRYALFTLFMMSRQANRRMFLFLYVFEWAGKVPMALKGTGVYKW